jgi:putative transposase
MLPAMPRTKRMYTAGLVCHVLNRAVARAEIFSSAADYAMFEEQLAAACEAVPVRLLTFCLMPNHWHLVVWPQAEGDLSAFMHRLTMTHTMRFDSRAAGPAGRRGSRRRVSPEPEPCK